MATITRTYLVDDLDGSEQDVSSVSFSLDKTDYEIDLSAANEARLRDKLAKFVAAATPLHPQRAVRRSAGKAVKAVKTPPVGREQTQAIREWARNNGHEVSDRGRISAAIQKAFDEAH